MLGFVSRITYETRLKPTKLFPQSGAVYPVTSFYECLQKAQDSQIISICESDIFKFVYRQYKLEIAECPIIQPKAALQEECPRLQD